MSYVLIIITIFLFSTLEITGKFIGVEISPITVTIYRFFTGGVILFPFAISKIRKNNLKLKTKDYLRMVLVGFINVSVSMLCLQYAIYFGKVSVVAVLISANPLFAAIFAKILLKQDFTFNKFIGMVIGLAGVVLIITTDNHHSNAHVINNELGILFACIASITFGFYTALSMKYVKYYGSTVTNSFAFIFGSIILMIASLFLGIRLTFEPSLTNIALIAYLGIFVTGIGYLCYFQGLKKVSASVGSMFFFLKPVITSILAYMFFGEHLHILQYVGFFIVLAGLDFDHFVSSERFTRRLSRYS